MATTTAPKIPPPAPSNGVITGPSKGTIGGNRKKQKRRAKQAAKQAGGQSTLDADIDPNADGEYNEDPLGYGEEEYDYSEADQDHYQDRYLPPQNGPDIAYQQPAPTGKKKNKKKRATNSTVGTYDHNMLSSLPHPPHPPTDFHHGGNGHNHHQGNIWNTSTQQERQNIKDFWLSLSEDDRKALLKIEKEAVLKKMKQQQKHSCSCSVCGRKRTAIEEELEVLYEGYYEELEQYAHHDHPPLPSTDTAVPLPLQHHHPHPLATPPPPLPHHKMSHLHEHLDDEELSDEEEYGSDEVEYSDEDADLESEQPRTHPGVPDFFNFGSHLTVKDNLLTVADDLLKNDGRKFIEMMEQLAERRMQRETRSQFEAETHSNYGPDDGSYSHEDPMTAGDEFDEEEESYASGEEYDDDMDEEDEMVSDSDRFKDCERHAKREQGGLTEEQRMQEGRRMFQIFAARMFEQRVLTAYREKVAAERQRKLLEELDDEDRVQAQREAKKQRDAQKKKDKKKQQQAAKAEEKAKRDAERAEEEARLREAEEKKQEEQRRRKEEQRRKREEEKRKQDEERAKKEADKLRRQQEEQQRREESERKAREQKAAEKARKEELRKRERDEREAREKENRDKKLQEDRERKEREAKANAERMAKEREKAAQQAAQAAQHPPPQITKRPSQAGMVAVPGVFPKQPTPGLASPHPSVATPAMPKASAPATKQRQASRQGSHASSPKQASSQLSSAPSKSSSPGSAGPQPSFVAPKTIMQKPSNQNNSAQPMLHPMPSTSPLNQAPMQPPPGMGHPGQHPGNFGNAGNAFMGGYPGFSGHQGPMMHGNLGQRGPFPMMQHQGPQMGAPNRMPYPGMNGLPVPPPGMMAPLGRGLGFPLDVPGHAQPPPGFGTPSPHPVNQTSPTGLAQPIPIGESQRQSLLTHSRQHSITDKEGEPTANQPIARPAPIQRPSSVKPHERSASNAEIEDLSKHLGSSALLDDTDEPIPANVLDNRRTSNAIPGSRNVTATGLGQIGAFGPSGASFASPPSTWNTPSFSQAPGMNQPGWGSLPTPGLSNWPSNTSAFGTNSGFGAIGGGHAPMQRSAGALRRPHAIRLAICQACRQLSAAPNAPGDGFHHADTILQQIELHHPPFDPPPTRGEIEVMSETEGDFQNGGGELHLRKDAPHAVFIKWEPEALASGPSHSLGGPRGPIGLGEIGSPMPGKTTPAGIGFGAPGMGRASLSGGSSGFGSLGTAPGGP